MREFDSLLQLVNQGDEAAWSRLFAMAYRDLRSLARAQLKSVGRTTFLEATELLHESYRRFCKAGQFIGRSSGQFYLYAARVMRSVIVDLVRKERARRRGHEVEHISRSAQLAEEVSVCVRWALHQPQAFASRVLRSGTHLDPRPHDSLGRVPPLMFRPRKTNRKSTVDRETYASARF